MLALDTWDIVLLAIAAFIAITSLLRLMQIYRDDLLKKLRSDFDKEQQHLKSEERRRKKKEAKEKAA
jgi:hypothetical protein